MAAGIAKTTTVVVIINLIVKLFGFLREALIAHGFGASAMTDAYLVAYTLPYFLQAILGFALITLVVPILTKYWAVGDNEGGYRLGSSLINLTFISLTVLSLLGIIFARGLVFITAPNLPAETAEVAVRLTRIMFPSVMLMGVAMVINGINNSCHRFAAGASAPGVSNVIIILGVIFFSSFGIDSLAWATLISFIGFLIIQIIPLHKHCFKYYPICDYRHPAIRKAFKDILPIVIGVAVNQIYFALNRVFASGMTEGSISALNYASKLMNLPVGIFVAAIAAVIYPVLAENTLDNNKTSLARTVNKGLGMVAIIAIPAAVGLIVLRTPIVTLVFEHGEFTAYATQITAYALLFFCLGLVAVAANMVITRAYYATGDVRTPVWMGFISIVINVIFSFILLGPLAHGGLALANSLAAIANTILLFFFLQRKFPDLGGQKFFTGCAKMLTASIVMGAVVWGLYKILLGFVPAGTFGLTLNVFITIIVGAMVYLLLCAVLKIEEFVLLMSFFQRKLKKLDKSTNN